PRGPHPCPTRRASDLGDKLLHGRPDMITKIKGLHHVTSLAADAQANHDFFTGVLGLRRVKKTVNFDAPDVYHFYYGNEAGAAGTDRKSTRLNSSHVKI